MDGKLRDTPKPMHRIIFGEKIYHSFIVRFVPLINPLTSNTGTQFSDRGNPTITETQTDKPPKANLQECKDLGDRQSLSQRVFLVVNEEPCLRAASIQSRPINVNLAGIWNFARHLQSLADCLSASDCKWWLQMTSCARKWHESIWITHTKFLQLHFVQGAL